MHDERLATTSAPPGVNLAEVGSLRTGGALAKHDGVEESLGVEPAVVLSTFDLEEEAIGWESTNQRVQPHREIPGRLQWSAVEEEEQLAPIRWLPSPLAKEIRGPGEGRCEGSGDVHSISLAR